MSDWINHADVACDAPAREEETRRRASFEELASALERITWTWCLAHNLGIAAALCRAFELGRDLQHALAYADERESYGARKRMRAEVMRDYFHSGCGRRAP